MHTPSPPPKNVPEWSSWGRGSGPYLVLAPHGGQRDLAAPLQPRRRGRRSRMNDLHSAEVAKILAAQLGGSFWINHAMDRNLLDLNRITQVRRQAPWLIELLDHLVSDIATRHQRVRILVVHGWNVNQGRCDLGVGANLEGFAADQPLEDLTVSRDFLCEHLFPLTYMTEADVTLGARYPARHRNNLLQIFRQDGSRCDELPPGLANVVRAGRCDAVQLELGIALRWPGPLREAFLDRLISSLEGSPGDLSAPAEASCDNDSHTHAVQVFDREAGTALMASVDSFGGGMCFGRLCAFLPDGRVGLYTGEARDPHQLGRDGPVFSPTSAGTDVAFDGSMLVTPDGEGYIDLEYALDKGTLVPASFRLQCTPATNHAHAAVRGTVSIGDQTHAIDAPGFTVAREWGALRRAGRSTLSVRACFDDGTSAVLRDRHRDGRHPDFVRIALDRDGYAPRNLTIADGERTVRIRPRNRMSIARPAGPSRRVRVTFGPADVEIEGSQLRGTAIYEYARLVDR